MRYSGQVRDRTGLPLVLCAILGQGVRVGAASGDEDTTAGSVRAPIRLVSGPVVDAAGPLDEQSETAELPTEDVVRLEVQRLTGPERLVPAPSDGFRGWATRFRDVLRHCGGPVLIVTALTAGPMYLFAARVSDMIFAAPLLSALFGGVGVLLIPAMWLAYLAMAALPVVLSLGATVAMVVGWAADGRLPGVGGVLRLVGHRVGLMWAWLALLGAVSQALPLLAAGPIAAPRLALALSAGLIVVSTALLVLMGMLGCVVLFERRRGPRRAQRLLLGAPPATLFVLVIASAALTVLPSAAAASFGLLCAAGTAVLCAVVWSLATLLTYAQARRLNGPVTSVALADELAD
jgi:hypothetical protein